jgi:hypothetical protein
MSKARPMIDFMNRKKTAVVRLPPKLFVLATGLYGSRDFRPASIRIRRGVYRYLIWRENNKKRELYLGKIKHHARQNRDRTSLAAGASTSPRRRRPGSAERIRGGTKAK